MTVKPRKATCVESAWEAYNGELRRFLLKRSGDREAADDLLQSVYTRALEHRQQFCELAAPRAWLFKVARHQWIDRQRRSGRLVLGDPPEVPVDEVTIEPVDSLVDCIARTLPHCAPEDRDILRQCDLEGVKQADYARCSGLSLPATKTRLRRARQRLRARLIKQCGIRFDDQGRICCHRAHRE